MPDATPGQVKEIEKAIQDALDLEEKGGKKNNDKAKELRKKAIKLADKYFKLPKGNLSGEPEYDESVDGEGVTHPVKGKGQVKLGKSAFVWKGKPSAAWLASTKIHEICHTMQLGPDNVFRPKVNPKPPKPKNKDADMVEIEVEAYNEELHKAKKTGIPDDQQEELRRRKRKEYKKLPEGRKKFWKGKEPWLADEPKAAPKSCAAYVYRARETGAIVMCSNDSGDSTRDFVKIGSGTFPCDQVVTCYFVK